MIKINAIIYKPLLSNTYVVHDEASKEAFIVDPGGQVEAIVKVMEAEKIIPKFILYTHLHLDHIAGGLQASEHFQIPSYANESDLYLFESLEQTSMFLQIPQVSPPVIDGNFGLDDELEIGDTIIKVIHTPGHTPGGTCFLVDNHLFTGDTLFKESIGRTDLWGGDYKAIMKSIKEKIFILPDSIEIHPGHGEYSTIGYEKRNNPHIR